MLFYVLDDSKWEQNSNFDVEFELDFELEFNIEIALFDKCEQQKILISVI